jgi:putative oxidoreductase
MQTLVILHAAAVRRIAAIGWLSPVLLRVAVGVTFISSGWGKLHDLEQVTRYFESLGIPGAGVQAPMVSAIELVGGALVLVGLGTRFAAALLAGVMAVATATAIWPQSDGVVAFLGSLEVVYLFVLAHLVIHGAGAASLDHVIAPSAPSFTRVTGATP